MDANQKSSLESLLRLTLKTLIGEGIRLEQDGANRLHQAYDKFFRDSTISKALGAKVSTAIARRIIKSIAGSQGLSLKAAQLASFLDSSLSLELSRILGDLQTFAKPLSQRRVQELFREAYPNFENLFFFIDWTPLAVTSLAQVHRAQLHSGQDVVLKVKHPEIHRIVRSQFPKIELLLILSELFGNAAKDVLQEIQEQVLNELDFHREVANQIAFRKHFENFPDIIVPQVHEDLCRPNIIVSEFIRGRTFKEFITFATPQQKEFAALTIATFHSASLLGMNKIHGDTHGSNFLFQEQSVVFLDYGRVIHCEPDSQLPRDCMKVLSRELDTHTVSHLDCESLHQSLFAANLWALFAELEVHPNWKKLAMDLQIKK